MNPDGAVEIPGLMAQRPDFYLLPFRRYSGMKTGKIGKFRIQSASFFSVQRPNKKKKF
jgi:hypothetical protein